MAPKPKTLIDYTGLFMGALGSVAAMGTWQDRATPRTLDHGTRAVIAVFSGAAGTV